MGTGIPGVVWPEFTAPGQPAVDVLERLESASAGTLRDGQLRQLRSLVEHARRTTRHGRKTLPDGHFGWEELARLPLMERRFVQEHDRALRSERPPPEHGAVGFSKTSGSTGTPVTVWKTRLCDSIWEATTSRFDRWFARDPRLPLAAIRFHPAAAWPGMEGTSWGAHAAVLGVYGPARMLHLTIPIADQVAWLDAAPFAWLTTFPSNLAELLRYCEQHGKRWPGLRAVMTVAEPVTDELRERCREVLGVEIEDQYSTQEVGYIALQCPSGRGYHVQSETIVVEVLRDDGAPCRPGEVGRVVVTPLHNFAMPLLRYDIGDLAEVGGACPCGRAHPLLTRIFGRTRNLLRLPDGGRIWPTLRSEGLMRAGPVVQIQYVQHALDAIEVRLVLRRPATPGEEEAMRAQVTGTLPAGLTSRLTYVEAIPRGPGGKFEDFVCRLP